MRNRGILTYKKGINKMGIEEKKKSAEQKIYEYCQRYTTSDIRRIVDAELNVAGLLLMPAFAGMITLGHSLYGYDISSKTAFLAFAYERMQIEHDLAEILYDVVYKGLIRQWMSETGVILDAVERGILWERRDEKKIVVYALEFALRYVGAVDLLPEYEDTPKHSLPDDKTEIEALRKQVRDFISARGEVE
jgi:hypothetical protein